MSKVSFLKTPSGETFYPVAHANATYLNDGKTVEEALKNLDGGKIDKDIVLAGNFTSFGNIKKKDDETVILPTAGKSITQFLEMVLTKEEQPIITQPRVSISLANAGAYESGSTFTPNYVCSFNNGKYTYDTTTGVELVDWEINDTNGNTDTASSGSFDSFVVDDTVTNYCITAKANYTDGNIATTNLGNISNPPMQIIAGSTSIISSSVYAYRSIFYGIVNHTNQLTSDDVRGLTNMGRYISTTTLTVRVNGNKNAKKIIIAIPKTLSAKVKKVLLKSALNSDITTLYVKNEVVQVDDVRGDGNNPVEYNIWTYQPASIDSGEVHEITLG